MASLWFLFIVLAAPSPRRVHASAVEAPRLALLALSSLGTAWSERPEHFKIALDNRFVESPRKSKWRESDVGGRLQALFQQQQVQSSEGPDAEAEGTKALRDLKQAEGDLDNLRDKIKNLLKDKIELENNFNMIQKHEITRLNELE
jgi:hypothetical protein